MDTTGTPPPFDAYLAGAQFRPKEAKEYLDSTIACAIDPVQFNLTRDYINPYDMFATEVHLDNHFVGFIEKAVAMWIGQWIDAGWAFKCELAQVDESGKRRHLLRCTPTGERIPTREEIEAARVEEYDRLQAGAKLLTGNDDDIPF